MTSDKEGGRWAALFFIRMADIRYRVQKTNLTLSIHSLFPTAPLKASP